jgi:signal transduction histidine kinase
MTCGLLAVVIAGYSWAAYRAVRQTVIAAANSRLSGVTDGLVMALETQSKQFRLTMDTVSRKPAFRNYLLAPDKRTEAAAMVALGEKGPNSQQMTAAELWSPTKKRLLSATIKRPAAGRTPDADEWPADSGVVGRFQNLSDTLVYPSIVPIREAGRTLGYVVEWRSITGPAQTQEMYSRLIGQEAGLYIGNDRGDVWTDLTKRVSGPPIDVRGAKGIVEYDREGSGHRMAFARPIKGMPWLVLIDFSSSAVLSPVGDFASRLLWFGVAIFLVGLLAAWVLGRGISRPIEQLTVAAEAVATGQQSHPVSGSRHAELARLAEAFNTMESRVTESQQRLEYRVAERTRELQERNEELEAFGYSISHDLRAPLRAMQGFSQILLDDYSDRLDNDGRRYAGKIVAAATRMDQLIRDLLTYSRVSREQLEPGRVSLSKVVKEAIEQIDAELQSRGAQVKVHEPLPPVVGHEATLSQVVVNLLGNGAKFMPPGRTPELTIRAEPRSGVVRLWVEDNGIGILAEHQERIFRVFERLHAPEEYPGTGIGLAIVRKGVERMGGKVGVESSLGTGSRFWIELPIVRSAA